MHTHAHRSYVIQGIEHNGAFLRTLLTHPTVAEGAASVDFIENEYKNGFEGIVLSDAQKELLAAVATTMHAVAPRSHADLGDLDDVICTVTPLLKIGEEDGTALSLSASIEQSWGGANTDEWDGSDFAANFSVALTGVDGSGGGSAVELSNVKYSSYARKLEATVDGELVVVQKVLDLAEGVRLQLEGGVYDVILRNRKAHALAPHMIERVPPDTSKMVLSPMPGQLISVAVQVGDKVEVGAPVAVVEAMKMQNTMRVATAGIVKSVNAEAGATLDVNQMIIELE